MHRALRHICLLAAAFLALTSCESEIQALIVSQEEWIDSYISSLPDSLQIVRNEGSNRVIVSPGTGPAIAEGDSAFILYAGYVMGDRGPGKQFVTLDSAMVRVGKGDLVKGLDKGLVGARGGEECLVLFTAKNGYYKENVGLVPEKSALLFDIFVKGVKETR